MRRLQHILTGTTAALALTVGCAAVASAADLGRPGPAPVYTKAPLAPAPFSWTGFYVGANAGYSWSNITTTSSADCPAVNGYFCSGGAAAGLANVAVINADGSSGSLKHNAFTGGAQAGYNWQFGSFVIGPELDIEAFSAKASSSAGRTYPGNAGATYIIGTSTDTDWLFTARARAGWAAGSVLLYATGGLATADLKVSNSFSDNNGVPGAAGNSSVSQAKVGWTAGGGAEWAFARNWSVRGEYLHVDLGSVSTTELITNPGTPGLSNSIRTTSKVTSEIARAGVNYRFGP